MDCQDTREVLEEFRRGELDSTGMALVEAHLGRCDACRRLLQQEAALASLVRRLTRVPAPAALHRRVRRLETPRGRYRGVLSRPWVAAAAAAVVVALLLSPWLSFRRTQPDDPLERFLQGGLTEHTRILLQLQTPSPDVSDPAAAFATVRSLTDVDLPPAFAGDAELTLIATRPTVIGDRKAAAVVLRDSAWFITTYFAVHGTDLPMPDTGRVQIDRYTPYMRRADGFNVIYWKQDEYAYLMVSDLDDPRSRQLFLKMRKAL
ncbi:MAG: anti-sigma factor family protein [Candidatus Rokuibacteriota bacterium]